MNSPVLVARLEFSVVPVTISVGLVACSSHEHLQGYRLDMAIPLLDTDAGPPPGAMSRMLDGYLIDARTLGREGCSPAEMNPCRIGIRIVNGDHTGRFPPKEPHPIRSH